MPTDYEQRAPGSDPRYRARPYAGVKQTRLQQRTALQGAVAEVGCLATREAAGEPLLAHADPRLCMWRLRSGG